MAINLLKRVMVNLMNNLAATTHFRCHFTEKEGENPEFLSP